MNNFNSAPRLISSHYPLLLISLARKKEKKKKKGKKLDSKFEFEYLNRGANPRFLCIAEGTGNDVVAMIESPEMVAEAELLCQYLCVPKAAANLQIDDVLDLPSSSPSPSSPILHAVRACPEPVAAAAAVTRFESVDCSDIIQEAVIESSTIKFVPSIRSGSYADIGSRKSMDDEHIRIDDLSAKMGSLFGCSLPSAFYAVFDGHGGPEAAAYIKRNAMRLFFEDVDIPPMSEINDTFLKELENCHRRAFLLADLALAGECSVSSSCGTTALTALILGRHLLVANAGDCRAVLCRKGQAVEMSQDHRPSYLPERQRVEALGGYIYDGFLNYLNGALSITRALGDWEMKFPDGSPSPLIAEPDFRQIILTEDDEFLIIGCDGIWDAMSNQHAVSLVRRGLRRHNNPQQCSRDLVMEALQLNTLDNLTAIVICFSSSDQPQRRRFRCCGLSEEARNRLKSLLEG